MTVLGVLLTRDAFDLYRKDGGVDAEARPKTTWTQVGSYRGTWGSPSSLDQEIAGRLDEQVEAVIGGVFPVRKGDQVRSLRGRTWRVLHVHETQVHKRAFLREVS